MQPASRGRLLWGWLGWIAWPALLVADTQTAVSQGWPLRAAGALRLIDLAAGLAIAVVTLLLVWPRWRAWTRDHAARLWALNASLLAALGLAEVLLAKWHPRPGFHLRPAQTVYAYDPDSFTMPGVFERAQTTINGWGLRGPEPPAASEQAYRMVCVGGSTTECYYLDDAESWPARMMNHLNGSGQNRYWVATAAVSELAVAHHARYVREGSLPPQTDCVIVMCGVNDVVRLLLGLDRGDEAPPHWTQCRSIELLQEVWNGRLGHGFLVDFDGRQLGLKRLGRAIPRPERDPDLASALAGYRARVQGLIAGARDRKLRLVCVTQPVLWDDFLTTLGLRRLRWARIYPFPRPWPYLQPGNLREVIDSYNDVLLEVCRETGTEHVDAAGTLNGLEQHFYDDYHLNETGCEALGKLLAEWFAAHPAPSATATP